MLQLVHCITCFSPVSCTWKKLVKVCVCVNAVTRFVCLILAVSPLNPSMCVSVAARVCSSSRQPFYSASNSDTCRNSCPIPELKGGVGGPVGAAQWSHRGRLHISQKELAVNPLAVIRDMHLVCCLSWTSFKVTAVSLCDWFTCYSLIHSPCCCRLSP